MDDFRDGQGVAEFARGVVTVMLREVYLPKAGTPQRTLEMGHEGMRASMWDLASFVPHVPLTQAFSFRRRRSMVAALILPSF